MLTNETRAVLLEALELLRQRAGYHEYLDNGDHRFTPDPAKNAAIAAAIAEVNAEAEWVPVHWGADSAYGDVIIRCMSTIKSATRQWDMPEVRLFQRTSSQSEAQDERLAPVLAALEEFDARVEQAKHVAASVPREVERTMRLALHRERVFIESSNLDKDHEARELARIDDAIAWLKQHAQSTQNGDN